MNRPGKHAAWAEPPLQAAVFPLWFTQPKANPTGLREQPKSTFCRGMHREHSPQLSLVCSARKEAGAAHGSCLIPAHFWEEDEVWCFFCFLFRLSHSEKGTTGSLPISKRPLLLHKGEKKKKKRLDGQKWSHTDHRHETKQNLLSVLELWKNKPDP